METLVAAQLAIMTVAKGSIMGIRLRAVQKSIVVVVVLAIASAASAATRVVVLPFVGSSPKPERDAWVSQAVQQNIIMTLGQSRGLQPIASKGAVPKVIDATVAIKAAGANGAEVAIFGTYEIIGDQIRLTGQVVTASGQSLGTARVAGGVENLLTLEDQLGEQMRLALSNTAPAVKEANEVIAAAPLLDAIGPTTPSVYSPWGTSYFSSTNSVGYVSGGTTYYGSPFVGSSVFSGFGGTNVGNSFSSGSALSITGGLHGKNWNLNFNIGAGQGLRTGTTVGGFRTTSSQ